MIVLGPPQVTKLAISTQDRMTGYGEQPILKKHRNKAQKRKYKWKIWHKITRRQENPVTRNGSQWIVHSNMWSQLFASTIWTSNALNPFSPISNKQHIHHCEKIHNLYAWKCLNSCDNLLPIPVLATCELEGREHPLYKLQLPTVKLGLHLVQPPHLQKAYTSLLQNSFQFLPLPAVNTRKKGINIHRNNWPKEKSGPISLMDSFKNMSMYELTCKLSDCVSLCSTRL